mmetsp:Transcript_39377/g.127426  ORF Transcript_39377/g.127426 Transcript_39377/m.127426 type:complete len:204 (-) Transcript_39377:301-912(-)
MGRYGEISRVDPSLVTARRSADHTSVVSRLSLGGLSAVSRSLSRISPVAARRSAAVGRRTPLALHGAGRDVAEGSRPPSATPRRHRRWQRGRVPARRAQSRRRSGGSRAREPPPPPPPRAPPPSPPQCAASQPLRTLAQPRWPRRPTLPAARGASRPRAGAVRSRRSDTTLAARGGRRHEGLPARRGGGGARAAPCRPRDEGC